MTFCVCFQFLAVNLTELMLSRKIVPTTTNLEPTSNTEFSTEKTQRNTFQSTFCRIQLRFLCRFNHFRIKLGISGLRSDLNRKNQIYRINSDVK